MEQIAACETLTKYAKHLPPAIWKKSRELVQLFDCKGKLEWSTGGYMKAPSAICGLPDGGFAVTDMEMNEVLPLFSM